MKSPNLLHTVRRQINVEVMLAGRTVTAAAWTCAAMRVADPVTQQLQVLWIQPVVARLR